MKSGAIHVNSNHLVRQNLRRIDGPLICQLVYRTTLSRQAAVGDFENQNRAIILFRKQIGRIDGQSNKLTNQKLNAMKSHEHGAHKHASFL